MNRQGVFLVCLLVIVAASVNAGVAKKKKDSRIVNGKPIKITEAPYIVQIRKSDTDFFFCGGSLVAPDTVISAAHCFVNKTPRDIKVVAGATLNNERGVESDILSISSAEDYDRFDEMSNSDIAVLKLRTPMVFSEYIDKIDLCDEVPKPGSIAKISGWGAKRERGESSPQLQTIDVPVIDQQLCGQKYAGFARVYGSMFCAADLNRQQDACQGDSGGPLVVNGKLCGVVSWGRGCARSNSPGVYTSIKTMKEFIHRKARI